MKLDNGLIQLDMYQMKVDQVKMGLQKVEGIIDGFAGGLSMQLNDTLMNFVDKLLECLKVLR